MNSDPAAARLAATSNALQAARQGGAPGELARALLRHADALLQAGQAQAARGALQEAAALHEGAGAAEDAQRCRDLDAQVAGLMQRHADALAAAGQALARAQDARGASAEGQADLALMWLSLRLAQGDAAGALAAACAARDAALAARTPQHYLAAVGALAQLQERAGRHVEAYGALAAGWVTLADLLGRDAAAAAFRPLLEDQRNRWGAAQFLQVKAQYEAGRRAAAKPDAA